MSASTMKQNMKSMILECADRLEIHRLDLINLLDPEARPERGRTRLKWWHNEETQRMFAEVRRLKAVIHCVRKHARDLSR